MSEFVYILSNPSMRGLLKVGYTATSIQERMNALNTTGIPTKFVLEFCIEVRNGLQAEQHLHSALGNFHYGKEFFRVSIPKVIEVCKKELLDGHIEFINYSGRANSAFFSPQELENIRLQVEKRKAVEEEGLRKARELRLKREESEAKEREMLKTKAQNFLFYLKKYNGIVKSRSELSNLSMLGRVTHMFSSHFEDGRKIAQTLEMEEKAEMQLFFGLIEFFDKRKELEQLLDKNLSHTFDALFDFYHFSFTTKAGEKMQARRFDGASERLTGVFYQLGLVKDRTVIFRRGYSK
jgi:hypothetical protein